MTMMWVGIGTGVASLAGGIYSSNKAADASSKAADKAAKISQQSSAAQLAFLQRQADLSRSDQAPFVQGGQGAYSEFLRQLGVAPAAPNPQSSFDISKGTCSYGSKLIALPGLSTTGVHSKQTSTDHNPLNPINNIGFGMLSETVRPGGGSPMAYYDPGSDAVYDAGGNLIRSNASKEGQWAGILSGFNNPVSTDANGNVMATGKHGAGSLGIQLKAMTDAEKAAYGKPAAGATSTGDGSRYGAYFASPGYNFLFDEAMRGAKASGAARGSLYSGAMLKELQSRATGLASQDYGNYMNRLFNASQLGQAAASQQAANSMNLGNNGATIIGNAASDRANAALVAGNASASSIMGANSSFQNLLGQAAYGMGHYYNNGVKTIQPIDANAAGNAGFNTLYANGAFASPT